MLPAESEVTERINKLRQQIPILINQSVSRTEVAVTFAQKIFKSLFDNDGVLYQDIRFDILERITDLNKKITKEITTWLFYFEDERRFHRIITPRLLRSQLISLTDFDAQLSKMIDPGRNKNALDFAVFLFRHVVIEGRFISPAELRETLEVISKLSRAKGQEEYVRYTHIIDHCFVLAAKLAAKTKQ